MRLYRLEKRQVLPLTIEKAWEFFSNPKNLEQITPPSLNLRADNEAPPKMYAGMIVTYVVRPFPGIRSRWVTEITHVDEPYLFVDEQRFGPYKFWHHQHRFQQVDEGVEAIDLIHYALPWGPLGRVANDLLVRRQLEHIFTHRSKVLKDLFGFPSGSKETADPPIPS